MLEVMALEVKLFYKTQRDLAVALNGLIDAYWDNEVNEDVFVNKIVELYTNNSNKLYKNKEFTTILKQQCGKRRLEVVGQVLSNKRLI
jgi:uncharacterized protein (TIGR04540 family)